MRGQFVRFLTSRSFPFFETLHPNSLFEVLIALMILVICSLLILVKFLDSAIGNGYV
jgi:hypothetical protein